MNRIFTRKFRNIFLVLIGIFILLFAFRLGYGYTLQEDEGESFGNVDFDSFSSDKRNYASDDFKKDYSVKDKLVENQVDFDPITATDQKYEKIAEVQTESHDFEKDEAYVREQVDSLDGIIQYEKKYGNEGKRRLQLQVGVPPDNFDTLYTILIRVGITHSREITKNDKTNEYLELNAKRKSLEKTHQSLVEFKNKNGRIDEFVNLENRILEIEKELQTLGVNLGDFDKSNEFCTIKFAMSEGKVKKKQEISFMHRCKVALQWTISWYIRLMFGLLFAGGLAYVIILLIEKSDFLKSIKDNMKSRSSNDKES